MNSHTELASEESKTENGHPCGTVVNDRWLPRFADDTIYLWDLKKDKQAAVIATSDLDPLKLLPQHAAGFTILAIPQGMAIARVVEDKDTRSTTIFFLNIKINAENDIEALKLITQKEIPGVPRDYQFDPENRWLLLPSKVSRGSDSHEYFLIDLLNLTSPVLQLDKKLQNHVYDSLKTSFITPEHLFVVSNANAATEARIISLNSIEKFSQEAKAEGDKPVHVVLKDHDEGELLIKFGKLEQQNSPLKKWFVKHGFTVSPNGQWLCAPMKYMTTTLDADGELEDPIIELGIQIYRQRDGIFTYECSFHESSITETLPEDQLFLLDDRIQGYFNPQWLADSTLVFLTSGGVEPKKTPWRYYPETKELLALTPAFYDFSACFELNPSQLRTYLELKKIPLAPYESTARYPNFSGTYSGARKQAITGATGIGVTVLVDMICSYLDDAASIVKDNLHLAKLSMFNRQPTQVSPSAAPSSHSRIMAP